MLSTQYITNPGETDHQQFAEGMEKNKKRNKQPSPTLALHFAMQYPYRHDTLWDTT